MRRSHLLLILAAGGLQLTTGCNRQAPPAAASSGPAAPAVTTVKPERKAVTRVVEQPGVVQPYEETALHAKISGFVGRISDDPARTDRPESDRYIDIGSRVKKDQVLVEIAIPELGEELKQKQALVEQAGAEITQAEKALAAAGTAIDSAKAAGKEAAAGVIKAEAEVDRWRTELAQSDDLFARKLIDSQSRAVTLKQFQSAEAAKSEAQARVESAAAAVRKAEADREKAAADVAAVTARKKVAEAEVGRVTALLGYTRIRAPFDGVVTHRSVSTGDYVTGSEKAGLFNVTRTDPVRVVVHVPEADAGLVREGQEVRLTVQALSRPGLTGKVTRTSWSLEPGSRTLRTEIDLPNPDGAVRPGMYVYAGITATLPEGWAVPAAAVGKAGDEFVVYRVVDGKAVRTPVQVGHGDGKITQLRRYKKPGATEWTEFTGTETVATPAAALTDGQAVAGP